jgi:serine/threonine protein kinase
MATKEIIETAFNSYQLLDIVGQGGAGRVWRARDSAGESVAVKILHKANSDARKRFKNEILFCERTKHENIVPVIDRGAAQIKGVSVPFYVMPLFSGSLRDACLGTDDCARLLRLFDQVMSGVEAAHLNGVVHRDLKPENVLFDKNNDRLLVGDFGIANFTDEELYTAVETSHSSRLANFIYAAPEQKVRGRAVDRRTDIYALGLILNELFTGDVPLAPGYRVIGSVAVDYGWLDEIVGRMIQQDPAQRYSTIDSVKLELVARHQDFVARQRLSEIQNTVVPLGEEDDPLALEPPKLVDFEWDRGTLTLIMDKAVTAHWVGALQGMRNFAYSESAHPTSFNFKGNKATVSAREHIVQAVIDHFKSWLPIATATYKNEREALRRRAAEEKVAEIQKQQQELARRERLRKTIRL